MNGKADAGGLDMRHLGAAAVLLALFSSSGCLTAAMWGWAAEPMPTSRATYRSGTYGSGTYGSRQASYRSGGSELKPARVAAAAVLTPATLALDVLFAYAALEGGSSDYNPFWGFECAAERKRKRAGDYVKTSYRRPGTSKPSKPTGPAKSGRGRKPTRYRSSGGGGRYSGAHYGKL